MSKLLLLAPLHLEAALLRGGPRTHVLRTGMGPVRARIAAARALARPESVVAVAGLCAGVDPGLAAGDVVCATTLTGPDGTSHELPVVPALVAALERQGLRVRTGPLLTLDHVAGPAERSRLTGVLAVDMESALLAEGAGGRPLAVVRIVADGAGRRLADPRIVAAGIRALRSLRRAGTGLAEWAAAVEQGAPTDVTLGAVR